MNSSNLEIEKLSPEISVADWIIARATGTTIYIAGDNYPQKITSDLEPFLKIKKLSNERETKGIHLSLKIDLLHEPFIEPSSLEQISTFERCKLYLIAPLYSSSKENIIRGEHVLNFMHFCFEHFSILDHAIIEGSLCVIATRVKNLVEADFPLEELTSSFVSIFNSHQNSDFLLKNELNSIYTRTSSLKNSIFNIAPNVNRNSIPEKKPLNDGEILNSINRNLDSLENVVTPLRNELAATKELLFQSEKANRTLTYQLAKAHSFIWAPSRLFSKPKRLMKLLLRRLPYSPVEFEAELFNRLLHHPEDKVRLWLKKAFLFKFSNRDSMREIATRLFSEKGYRAP